MLAVWRHLVLALAILGVVGCGISPQPTPPGVDPEVDVAQLSMSISGVGAVEIAGTAGAVDPPQGSVRVYNLDDAASEADAAVASDGSFTLVLPGDLGQGYRLQARIEQERSRPLDVTGTTDGAPVAVLAVPFGDCLVSVPELELEFAPQALASPLSRAVVTYDNGCATAVTLVSATLRKGGADAFQIMQPGQFPKPLAPEAEDVAEVGFKAMTTGSFEDLLFVELEMAGGPRRIVTVRGDIVP